jgi:hypothetical protein
MTGRQLGGWICTVVGAACTAFLLLSSLADGNFDWITDMSRLPKYALAGPLPLIGGLIVLRDEYGKQGPGSDAPKEQ